MTRSPGMRAALLRAREWLVTATAPDGLGDEFLNEGKGWDLALDVLKQINVALAEDARE